MHQGNLNGQYYIKESSGLGGKVLLLIVEVLASPFRFAFKYQVIRAFNFYGFSTWFDLLPT